MRTVRIGSYAPVYLVLWTMNRNKSLKMGVYEYIPTSMSYEGNNRGKREAPARTGREHGTRETKTTKVNSIM